MACCTGGMAEGAALPRGDTEDTEVRIELLSRTKITPYFLSAGLQEALRLRGRDWTRGQIQVLTRERVIIVKLRSRSRSGQRQVR